MCCTFIYEESIVAITDQYGTCVLLKFDNIISHEILNRLLHMFVSYLILFVDNKHTINSTIESKLFLFNLKMSKAVIF